MPKTPNTPPLETLPRRTLTMDMDHYAKMLHAPEMSEARKHELLDALWLTIVNYADLGYELELEDSCGKPAQNAQDTPDGPRSVLHSEHTNTFKTAAANMPHAPRPPIKQEAS